MSTQAGSGAPAWKPTHLIAWRPSGESEDQAIFVALHDGAAYTLYEWRTGTNADWERASDGAWTCKGQATPGGESGEVTLFDLSAPCQWRSVNWNICGQLATHYRWLDESGEVSPCCEEHAAEWPMESMPLPFSIDHSQCPEDGPCVVDAITTHTTEF